MRRAYAASPRAAARRRYSGSAVVAEELPDPELQAHPEAAYGQVSGMANVPTVNPS